MRTMVISVVLLSVGFVLGLLAAPQLYPPHPSPREPVYQNVALQELQRQFRDLSKAVAPSVVAVRGQGASPRGRWGGQYESSGSGFVFAEGGYILTNEHVVRGVSEIHVVLSDGRELPAELKGSDSRTDLAVIKVSADLPALPLCELEQIAQGDLVAAVGNPFGLANRDGQPAFSAGEVSKLGVTLSGLGAEDDRHYSNMVQTSAPIHPGSSGGPLLNLAGQVIGVNTAVQRSLRRGAAEALSVEPVGFAIPFTERTRSIIARISQGEEIRYGWLGVTLGDRLPDGGGRREVYVTRVHPGGPADKAGVKERDVVTHFGGREITDVDQLIREIGGYPVGEQAEIRVRRDGGALSLQAMMSDRETELAVLGGAPPAGSYRWRGLLLSDYAEGGVLVLDVLPDSPAQQAGIRIGAVILGVGGAETRDLRQFRRAVANLRGAVKIALQNGKSVDLPDAD